VQFDDVRVVDLTHDLHFALNGHLVFALETGLVNHFDSHV
jgi:hypothetical protein